MRISRILTIGLLSVILTTGGLLASTIAQEATPEATAVVPSDGYPVAIHQGTCEEPVAEPAWLFDNAVQPGTRDDDNGDADNVVGTTTTTAVVSETSMTIDFQLEDLANDGHVVAVHASSDEFGTILACGQIAGLVDDGRLIVPLTPVDDGTVVGIAVIDEDESGFFDLSDDQTQVTVYVFDSTATETTAS